tara:strand:+ start:1045 stop:1494 length:450 start_codon:yes stop_codon:yes gene_type:complete
MTTVIRASDNWDSSIPSNVVSATNDTQIILSSTSWVDIGLSVSITLASTASKVKLEYAIQNFRIITTNTGLSFRLVRDSTPLFTAGGGYSSYTSTANTHLSTSNIEIDSPASTAAITYKVQAQGYSTAAVWINSSSLYRNTLIATEIAG